MTVHRLRTLKSYFEAVRDGRKTFEIRYNDRDFKVGDRLLLVLYFPSRDEELDELEVEVTYVLPGGVFGVDEEYVVMSIAKVEP